MLGFCQNVSHVDVAANLSNLLGRYVELGYFLGRSLRCPGATIRDTNMSNRPT